MALLEIETQMGKDLGLVEDQLIAFVEKNLTIVAAQEKKRTERSVD